MGKMYKSIVNQSTDQSTDQSSDVTTNIAVKQSTD
jgi:hypothetical protein